MTRLYKPQTAIAIIIANMIGTGVFTSLGFQLIDIQSGFAIIMLWVIGGITALCGALTYAELGSTYPRSGGEYNFLTRIYHPVAGFTSGWISSTIGFSAPTALAAITFAAYLTSVFPSLSRDWLAIGLILIMAVIHSTKRSGSGSIQLIFTLIKVVFIVLFIIVGLLILEQPQPVIFTPNNDNISLLFSSGFAVSLIYVNYAYTGWNAATYISSELESPQKSLPRILLTGTLTVTVIYVFLNFLFMYSTPISSMQGQLEIGVIAAQNIWGETGAKIMGISMALLLISTVSAMTIAGPRVLQVIGEDFKVFAFLGNTNEDGIPSVAIWFQTTLAIVFVITASFESILIFAGFALALNNLLAVGGIFVSRYRHKQLDRPYRTWLFPFSPILYCAITLWTLVYLLVERPAETFASLGIIALGVVTYFVTKNRD